MGRSECGAEPCAEPAIKHWEAGGEARESSKGWVVIGGGLLENVGRMVGRMGGERASATGFAWVGVVRNLAKSSCRDEEGHSDLLFTK